MPKLKYFRIDALNNFESQHLVISSDGYIETIKGTKVNLGKISKKKTFFDKLDEALILDFKMVSHFINANDYYHISVIFDDETEESHFYLDNLMKNNQITLRKVLIDFIPKEYLINCISEE